MSIYNTKVWRSGCNYLVLNEGEVCSKCGQVHSQTAEEAGHELFTKKEDKERDLPQG